MTMAVRVCTWLVLTGFGLILAGCGNVPQPFRDSAKTSLSSLPAPQPSAGLVLEPIQPLSGADGDLQKLHDQVIKRLHGLEIAATALEISNRYRVAGRVQRLRDSAGTSRLVFTWTLLTAARVQVATLQHGVLVDTAKWQQADPTTAKRVATEIAYRIDDLIDGNGNQRAELSADETAQRALQVTMAPVQETAGGALELSIAMRRALRRNQVDVVDTAPGVPVVSVRTSTTRVGGSEDLVVIVWAVRDVDGRQRGQLKQQNRVPAGKLKFRWGTTAALAANAAAGDLIDLLRRLRADDQGRSGDR